MSPSHHITFYGANESLCEHTHVYYTHTLINRIKVVMVIDEADYYIITRVVVSAGNKSCSPAALACALWMKYIDIIYYNAYTIFMS